MIPIIFDYRNQFILIVNLILTVIYKEKENQKLNHIKSNQKQFILFIIRSSKDCGLRECSFSILSVINFWLAFASLFFKILSPEVAMKFPESSY